MRYASGFVLLLFAACGARTGLETPSGLDASRPPDAGLDAPAAIDAPTPDAFLTPDANTPTDAPPDAFTIDAGDPCEIGPAPLAGPLCTRALFGHAPTLSCPGGFVDVAAQGPGSLVWECEGVRAEARFGARVYRGQRVGDQVALCIRTEFDYVDGCRWQSSQRIEGDASGSELLLSYRELSIRGDGDCFPPCTADSVVELR